MLEKIISPRKAKERPFILFFIGMLYSSLSLFLTNLLFKGDAVLSRHIPLLSVAFTTIFSIPFIHSLIRIQEIKNVTEHKGLNIFAGHSRALLALLFLFLGFLFAFSFWYIVLPEDAVALNFQTQIEKFCSINTETMQNCFAEYGIQTVTGKAVAGMQDFYAILQNNLYVLLFTLIFSLTFGAGAIFILAWNASVIATAIGILARVNFADFYMPFLMYMFHGIPEIAAYLLIALAGGILSTALVRRDIKHGRGRVLLNVILLILVSVLLLFIAALIEVYITPLIFG